MKTRNIVVLILLALVGGALPLLPSVKSLENSSIDQRFEYRGPLPRKSKVVVVAIDDATERDWLAIPKAFWASKLAELVEKARAQGAERIGLDMVVSVDADAFMAEKGLDGAPNLDLDIQVHDSAGTVFLGTRAGNDLASPLSDTSDGRELLSVNTLQDSRFVIREVPRFDNTLDPPLKSLSYGLAGQKDGRRDPIQINFSGRDPIVVSGLDLLNGKSDPGLLKGAIVLIGETYSESQDRIDTPFKNGVPGVMVHAEAIESLLEGRELKFLPLAGVVFCCAVICVAFGMAAHIASIGKYLTVSIVCVVVWSVAGVLAFNEAHFVLPLVAPVLSFSIVPALVVFPMRAIEERHERLWARSQWGQMVSDEFVQVLEQQRSAGLGSMEVFRASLMFLDVAGFSEKSNRLPSHEVVAGLNALFEPIIACVGARGGTVLNFIGDGVVAMFHKGESNEHMQDALRASLDILSSVDALDSKTGEDWNVRIGLAVGDVNLALVGNKERKQMTVYGSAVNMAARLEQAGKSLGTRLAASVEFEPLADSRFTRGKIQPKGWDEEVEVLSLQE